MSRILKMSLALTCCIIVASLLEVGNTEPVLLGSHFGFPQQQFTGDILPARDCELICRGFCIRNGPIGGADYLGSGCSRECDCSYYYKMYPSWFQTAPILMGV